MEIEYRGANCVVMSTKNATVVVDPKLSAVGLKDVKIKNAIQLATIEEAIVASDDQRLIIDGPGEYEVADVSIKGVAAQQHIDTEDDVKKATMYRIDMGGVRTGVIGHVYSQLSDDQLEQLGTLDVVIIPVGGNGYTLDAHAAAAIIRRISPKVVIPTHYADEKLSYEVTQAELAPFIKELAATHEMVPKFKVKNGILPEMMTLVEISRTA